MGTAETTKTSNAREPAGQSWPSPTAVCKKLNCKIPNFTTKRYTDLQVHPHLLDIDVLAANLMIALQADLIDRIVIIKLDETEATLLAGLLVRDNADGIDGTEALEVHPQIVLLVVVLQTTDEQLLDRGTGLGSADLLPRDGALRLDDAPVDAMGTGVLGVVDHVGARVGDEAEAARALGLGVLHDDDVDDVAPGLEVLLQGVVGRAVVEPADEELAHVLGLVFAILRNREGLGLVLGVCVCWWVGCSV